MKTRIENVVIRTLGLLAVAWSSSMSMAHAADAYPARPITLIVPFPAGGVTDIVGRELAQRLTLALGQPVIVENRAGAAGNIGTLALARAKADGYTLGVLTVSAISIAPNLNKNIGFDPARDFTPITNLVNTPGAIIAGMQTPFSTFAEFTQYAKANPGKVTYASVGPGSIPHLTAEMMAKEVGLKLVHIPYKGAAPALQDVLGGHVDLSFETSLVTTVTNYRQHRVKVLAITGPDRVSVMPDVPTVAEAGYPRFSAQGWFGLFGPRDLPAVITEKLNKSATEVLSDARLRQKLDELGMHPAASSPQQFRGFLDQQEKLWSKVVRDLNIPLE